MKLLPDRGREREGARARYEERTSSGELIEREGRRGGGREEAERNRRTRTGSDKQKQLSRNGND